MSLPFTPLYIDGEWRPASTGATFDVRNPASGEVVGTAASASQEDCAAAVQAAAQAFKTWELSPPGMRRDILIRASEVLAWKRERIRRASREEVAQTEEWMWANCDRPTEALKEIAAMTASLKGETAVSVIPGGYAFTQRRAIGVVFSIAPWNAPIYLALRAIAVPIICGNTVVLRMSEACPRVQSIVIEAFAEVNRALYHALLARSPIVKAGLPKGVLNCLSTNRDDAPARTAEIIANPAVRKINVLDDADIPRAARAIASGALINSGQICMSTERVIVQRGAAESLVQQLTTLFKRVKAGVPATDGTTHIGAVIDEASAQNAIGMIKDAIRRGAKLFVGDLRRRGTILQPHLVADVKPDMPIWNKETFGPVVVLAVVDTVDEAITLANTAEYTLTSSVWTKDVHKAFDVATRMRNGTNNINGSTLHSETLRENEGLGGKTGYGSFMMEDWTQLRLIVLHPQQEPPYPVVAKL
ncbi:aldehyde dehydrogenase [Trametes maxima]|nr:aldehyde dehydrogenase [Trametes maxima]